MDLWKPPRLPTCPIAFGIMSTTLLSNRVTVVELPLHRTHDALLLLAKTDGLTVRFIAIFLTECAMTGLPVVPHGLVGELVIVMLTVDLLSLSPV